MLGTGAPTNVKVNSPCPKCMVVQWDKVTISSPAVRLLGYHVILKSRDHPDVTRDVGASVQMTNVTGLQPFTEYIITVAAKTDGGLGMFSRPIAETTQEGGKCSFFVCLAAGVLAKLGVWKKIQWLAILL